MEMPVPELAAFKALAQSLADLSGNIVRRYFRQRLVVDSKADSTPVTVADREVERAVREHLELHRPEDGIIGEEFGGLRTEAEFVWVIDPIDGTGSFVCGRPIFGTLIALVQAGVPILGIIDQPVIGERWIGWRSGATLNGQPVRTRPCNGLSTGLLATTSPKLFRGEKVERYLKVEENALRVVYGGDCYNYGVLAAGYLDAVVESGLKTHDYCALVPIVEGAGGKMTDWDGNSIDVGSDGDIVATGDPRVHADIVSLLKDGRS